ncbi:MAG TPA: single-stranded DNA-binding protein [Clostridiales bacterium]|nr:single-stranded DNA-binding protein [Clostridiales bacterium]
MLNRIVLIGRLVRDPELRYTPNGVATATFTLAVDRPFVNQKGERETDFIDIVTWRKLAEVCASHLGKGRLVAVDGRLQIRSYETSEGQRRRVAEVVAQDVRFLDSPDRSREALGGGQLSREGSFEEAGGTDEDIPF